MRPRCSRLTGETVARGARDIYAALDALKARPDIDANRIFVQGVGLGASAALFAIDAAPHKVKLAGAIAISPHCREDAVPSVPILILTGERDLCAPAAHCQALARAPNVEIKVYPGVGHAFAMPFGHRAQHNLDAALTCMRFVDVSPNTVSGRPSLCFAC